MTENNYEEMIDQALLGASLDDHRQELLDYWRTTYANRATPLADLYDDFRLITSENSPAGSFGPHRTHLPRDGQPVDLLQVLLGVYLSQPLIRQKEERDQVITQLELMLTRPDDDLLQLWDKYARQAGASRLTSETIRTDIESYTFQEHPIVSKHPLDEEGVPTTAVGALLGLAAVQRVGFLARFAPPPLRGVPWTA